MERGELDVGISTIVVPRLAVGSGDIEGKLRLDRMVHREELTNVLGEALAARRKAAHRPPEKKPARP
jgi:hypothetical protein